MMQSRSRRFGAYEILILDDGIFEAPADIIIHGGGEAARARAIAAWGRPTIRIPVNCFALRHADGITLVDAGTDSSWGPALGLTRASLAAAGIAPEQVGQVLITHLHGDHALGLFDGERPAFPAAEIVVPRTDLDHYTDAAKRDATPAARRSPFAIAERLIRLYGSAVRAVDPGTVRPGIEIMPLPGHTIGHSGYLIAGDDADLLLWGDALHLGELQAADPDIGLVYDFDAGQAIASRRAILARAASEEWLVSGGHVEGFSRVLPADGGYRLVREDG